MNETNDAASLANTLVKNETLHLKKNRTEEDTETSDNLARKKGLSKNLKVATDSAKDIK